MLLSISTFSSLPPPLSSSFFLTKTTVQCPAQKHISHHLSRADSDCSTNENLRFAAGKMLLPSTDEKVIPESTKHLPQPLHCPQQRLLEEKGLRTTQTNVLEQQQCETSQRKQPAWAYLSARGYYFGTETGTNYQREKPLMSTQTISRVPSEGRSLAKHPGRPARGSSQQLALLFHWRSSREPGGFGASLAHQYTRAEYTLPAQTAHEEGITFPSYPYTLHPRLDPAPENLTWSVGWVENSAKQNWEIQVNLQCLAKQHVAKSLMKAMRFSL